MPPAEGGGMEISMKEKIKQIVCDALEELNAQLEDDNKLD